MSLCGKGSDTADCVCLKDVTLLRLNAHCDHIAWGGLLLELAVAMIAPYMCGCG
jgi:hypothetical protein